jgi:hypothetical protein
MIGRIFDILPKSFRQLRNALYQQYTLAGIAIGKHYAYLFYIGKI